MIFYKNTEGEVFAYENDGSQDSLIGDKKKMTQSEIYEHLNPPPAPPSKQTLLATITVTTQAGNTFDGNETAIARMANAIMVAERIGQNESEWKMADNTKVIITLDELKEAHTLAMMRLGEIVLA